MNYGTVDLLQGIRDMFRDCRENCRGVCRGCDDSSSGIHQIEHQFNIDNRQSRPMVITCWLVFGLCISILGISLPIVMVNHVITPSNKLQFGVFYGIAVFFLLISIIANALSCYSMIRSRQRARYAAVNNDNHNEYESENYA